MQTISNALEVDYEELANCGKPDLEKKDSDQNKIWLPILHLSGLFILLFPPIIIWIWKKDKVKNIREHAIDVVNFQLSMFIYFMTAGFLVLLLIGLPIVIFLGIFSTVVIIINTIKVVNQQAYKYPWSLNILKKHN